VLDARPLAEALGIRMGTEIIVITIWQLLLLAYSLIVLIFRFIAIKLDLLSDGYGLIYKINSVAVLLLSVSIVVWWFLAISANYKFSLGYVLIVQLPLILISVRLLLPFSQWVSLTKSSRKDAESGAA